MLNHPVVIDYFESKYRASPTCADLPPGTAIAWIGDTVNESSEGKMTSVAGPFARLMTLALIRLRSTKKFL